jgi:hypothetical protein
MTRLRLFLFLTSLSFSPQLFAQPLQGRVISQSGEPLAGVKIWTEPAMAYENPPETNSEGRFSLSVSRRRLRFTRDGFKSTTAILTPGREITVVLIKDDAPAWQPSPCERAPTILEWRAMRFVLPKGAKIKQFSCSDACTGTITYKKARLAFGEGGNWSSGYPTQDFFEDAKQVMGREIQGGKSPFWEYRATTSKETYSRWIGAFGITVQYNHTTKQEAVYFDQILDSLCWHPDFVKP